jgi:hypothetical protein
MMGERDPDRKPGIEAVRAAHRRGGVEIQVATKQPRICTSREGNR